MPYGQKRLKHQATWPRIGRMEAREQVSPALAGGIQEAELTTDSPDFTEKRIPIREISEIRGQFVHGAIVLFTKASFLFADHIFLPRFGIPLFNPMPSP